MSGIDVRTWSDEGLRERGDYLRHLIARDDDLGAAASIVVVENEQWRRAIGGIVLDADGGQR
jgi:hypothetical protein